MLWSFCHVNTLRMLSSGMVCRKKTISFLLLILFVSILSCYAAVDPNYTKESFHFKYVINPEPTTNMYFCNNPEEPYNEDFTSLPEVDNETNLEEPLFYFRFFSNETGTWKLTISFTSFESESTGTKLPYFVTVGKTDDRSFSKTYEISNSGLTQKDLDSLSIGQGKSINSVYSFTYNLEAAFNTGVALDDYVATITIGADGP